MWISSNPAITFIHFRASRNPKTSIRLSIRCSPARILWYLEFLITHTNKQCRRANTGNFVACYAHVDCCCFRPNQPLSATQSTVAANIVAVSGDNVDRFDDKNGQNFRQSYQSSASSVSLLLVERTSNKFAAKLPMWTIGRLVERLKRCASRKTLRLCRPHYILVASTSRSIWQWQHWELLLRNVRLVACYKSPYSLGDNVVATKYQCGVWTWTWTRLMADDVAQLSDCAWQWWSCVSADLVDGIVIPYIRS